MAFKENLKVELEYKGMKVKELAARTGINKRTLDQYLASAAKMPSAENAVKIADALEVSVEYLVTGRGTQGGQQCEDGGATVVLYKKYHELIADLEQLSQPKKAIVRQLARVLADDSAH